jgi:hypothetical protein
MKLIQLSKAKQIKELMRKFPGLTKEEAEEIYKLFNDKEK